jgi:recyclin-1
MIEIFYSNELVSNKIVNKNEFLNNTNQVKKQFESLLDNFVANGLNIGIDKLMDEIEFLFNALQLINDFNPKVKDPDNPEIINPGPTKCATRVVNLLSNHINLLNGSTEKGIIDVFQQEIGERFFQLICKNIKKRMISSTGAIILISDLNLYYDFIINVLRQKNITPLFVGLKEVAQLYLIQTKDSKKLGKLIGDLNKFNGIFKQEEIYEFVQRRTDWFKIKKDVEKAMYGLGLIDCVIM